MRRKRTLFSLAFGLTLLALLIYKNEPEQLGRTLASLKLTWWAGALLLYLMAQVISSYRWQILLKAEEILIPLSRLITFYFAGMFFNLFLPTTVGGDALRGYIMYNSTEKREAAAVSVLVERFIGMGALLMIGLVAALITRLEMALWPMVALNILFFLLILIASHEGLSHLPVRLLYRFGLRRWGESASRLYRAFRLYGSHRRALIKAGVLSFILQSLGVLGYYLLGRALNVSISPLYFFLFIPLVTAASMLPITFSGLGVREGASLVLFSQVGVPAATAISLGLSWWLTVTLLSLLGTPLWVRRGIMG